MITPVKASYGELFARLTLCALIVAALFFTVANAWGRTPLFLLRALQSLPVYHLDRGPEHAQLKDQQMQTAAAAIQEFSKGDPDLAAMLVTVGFHESGWSLAIAAGHCRPKQCDPDRNGVPRAHGSYQIHRVAASSREAWEAARTDIRVATQEAAFVLRRMRAMCRGDVRRSFIAYGGRGCDGKLPDIEKRVETFRKVRKEL